MIPIIHWGTKQEKSTENVKCYLFTHEAPKSSRYSFKGVRAFQVKLEFSNVGFCEGRKTGVPGEKPSEQGQEPTTNSTHIWRRVRESNPGHIGWRRVLSPLRHPCSLTSRSQYIKWELSQRKHFDTNHCDHKSLPFQGISHQMLPANEDRRPLRLFYFCNYEPNQIINLWKGLVHSCWLQKWLYINFNNMPLY